MIISSLYVFRRFGAYHLRLRIGDKVYDQMTDTRLGSIMSAFSVMFKAIAVDADWTSGLNTETTARYGTIPIDLFQIRKNAVYELYMKSGDFTFTCTFDPTVEMLLYTLMAAMKFFGQKYGLLYLYDEVARNVDQAHEQGFER